MTLADIEGGQEAGDGPAARGAGAPALSLSLVGYLATLLVVLILAPSSGRARPPGALRLVRRGLDGGDRRYLIYKAYFQVEPPPEAALEWERRFIFGTILAGACWMAMGTILLPDSTRIGQRLSVVMLVSCS
jgi:hypothetical protein